MRVLADEVNCWPVLVCIFLYVWRAYDAQTTLIFVSIRQYSSVFVSLRQPSSVFVSLYCFQLITQASRQKTYEQAIQIYLCQWALAMVASIWREQFENRGRKFCWVRYLVRMCNLWIRQVFHLVMVRIPLNFFFNLLNYYNFIKSWDIFVGNSKILDTTIPMTQRPVVQNWLNPGITFQQFVCEFKNISSGVLSGWRRVFIFKVLKKTLTDEWKYKY